MKIHPMTAGLFHAHGRTDTTKLIVAFRNFAKSDYEICDDTRTGKTF